MSLFAASIVIACAWGALSYAAVYTWGYVPLLAVCGGVGVVGLRGDSGGRGAGRSRRVLAIALLLLMVATAVQLVPLPPTLLRTITPHRAAVVEALHAANRGGADAGSAGTWEPTSIAPANTTRLLVFLVIWSVFLLGLIQRLDTREIAAIVTALTAVGVLLTIMGLAWRPMVPRDVEIVSGGARLLVVPAGTPTTTSPIDTFGPFGNRNHFAGWIAMVLPIAICGWYAQFHERRLAGAAGGGRIASLRAGALAAGILLMAIAVFATHSRSGVGALLLGVLAIGVRLVRQQHFTSRRALIGYGISVALLLAIAVASGQAALIARRYASLPQTHMGGRIGIWIDALRIARDFWPVGTGLNAYQPAAVAYRTTSFEAEAAHNDYLELAASGGLLVAIPSLLLASVFARELRSRASREHRSSDSAWIRSGAVIGIVALGFQELFDFSLHMPGVAVLFVVLCAIAVHDYPQPE